jgi:hypothetical protein
LDIRYGGPHDWTAEMGMSDTLPDPEYLFINSEYFQGERAYQQSYKVSNNIYEAMKHENFQKIFKVGKYLEDSK